MAASVSSRSRGAATASAAASAAAELFVSLFWLMISPPEEPKQQGAFFHWSLVTNPGPGMVLRAQAPAVEAPDERSARSGLCRPVTSRLPNRRDPVMAYHLPGGGMRAP